MMKHLVEELNGLFAESVKLERTINGNNKRPGYGE
jgi:hypothetical protein